MSFHHSRFTAVATLVTALLTRPAVGCPQDRPAQAGSDRPRFATDIVVTPERGETPRHLVPASIVVVDEQTPPKLPAVTFGEIVSFLPGFVFQQAQPYSMPPLVSARGFFGGGEADYVVLLVDGVPIADAESGLVDWAQVPPSSIRRIEAFRGPGASMYGDAAIGGVIQVFTDRTAGGGRASFSGGSFATFIGDASYGRRMQRAGLFVSGSALRTDGFTTHSAGHDVQGTASIDGHLRGAPWRWTLGGHERDRDDPGVRPADAVLIDPLGSDRLSRFDNRQRHGLTTSFTLNRSGAAWQTRARVHVAGRGEDRVRTVLLAPGLGDRRARALSTLAVGGSVEADRLFNVAKQPVTLRFGVDLSREHLDTDYRGVNDSGAIGAVTADASGRRARGGAFVLADWDPAPRLRVSAAARWDRIGDDFTGRLATSATHNAGSPRVSATVLLDRERSISLFSQVGTAFKAPTVDQLFDPRPYPDFRGGTFTIANPLLVPQRATNVEAGIQGGSRVHWSALAYRMRVDNEIDFDARTFSYANIGHSRHTGVELEAGGALWPRVQPSVTYALTRVIDDDSGLQLKNIPRHVFSAGIQVDLPWKVAMSARYRHTAGAFFDDDDVFRIQGPSTLDIRVRRQLGRHAVFVDAINVGDHHYQEYGFTLVGFDGRRVPYAYPGAPRGIRVGFNAAF